MNMSIAGSMGGSLMTSLKETTFADVLTRYFSRLQGSRRLEHLLEMLVKVVYLKLVYREPPPSIILQPAENLSYRVNILPA